MATIGGLPVDLYTFGRIAVNEQFFGGLIAGVLMFGFGCFCSHEVIFLSETILPKFAKGLIGLVFLSGGGLLLVDVFKTLVK